MSRVITGDIQDLTVSWENYAGSSVERFIKEQLGASCGYIYRSATKEGDYYYLYGFHSIEDYQEWAGGGSITPLFRVQLPNLENDVFAAQIYTDSNTTKLVNLGEGISINLRYTSTSTNPTTMVVTDTYNEGTLIINRSANGSAFEEVARIIISPMSHTSSSYQSFDITDYLADGDNVLRIRVEDNVNGSVSNTIVFNSIINTTLALSSATPLTTPLTAPTFRYYIEGEVAKTLNVKVTQGENEDTYTFAVGTTTWAESPYFAQTDGTYETGVIDVEAWLSVDNTTLESEHIFNQYYFVDEEEVNDVIILNNVETDVINYTNTHFFDFVVYNASTDVRIQIQGNGNTYLDYTFNDVDINTVYSFNNILQIESNSDEISATVTVTTDSGSQTYNISVDNAEKMSPVEGANFILNPLLRSNTETNPNAIINSVNNSVVTSTFNNFGFVNDGWLEDTDGIKVLRVPAGRSVQINYDTLDNLTNGTTIEFDYKVYNVFNDNDEVLKMYTVNSLDKTLGFVMNATEAAFYTAENQTKRDQDVMFQEEHRTHMAINIIPNLSGSGLNYIRIFINGVMNREMMYSNNDVFKSGDVRLIFGSEHCDIDIYSIRVYKKALSAANVRQDYLSSIPTLEGKLAFKAANNILSANGTISYDKAKNLYNTLIWTGNHPEYSTGNEEYRGTLQVNIIDDPDHSGTMTNMRIKGQGSSSRGYWKWNHQYDMNKYDDADSVWTDGNGVEHTNGYKLTDDDPAATKLVAKLNWASSMQSHKIGSTALYTDLWREIVGGNSITATQGYENARVTVHEKPFLYFIKENSNSTPVFAGLMTFGSGKYDKATFGYKSSVFPDYLIIEGSDNGLPLTNRQVPWFDDEVTYNSDEEYYEYAGQGSWDYGMGNQNMLHYFRDASNFVYLHSRRLLPYTSNSDLTDRSYQYWNTSTYNVVRYDWINGTWVNAGATKTNGEYDVLNIATQTGITPTGDNSADNAAFIAWRTADFKTYVGNYYNTTDVIFSMAFLKLVAASDNRCKNTYEYLDPETYKICLAQDDMDTLMLTDNVGRKTKPYYVEEHDKNANNQYYFNGEDNNFFTLMDYAFNVELRAMMKTILNTMASSDFGGSVEQCLRDYFFDVQEYFPAVAFNETARLLYEEASVAQSQGVYQNGTPAISQSLGDQLQAEKQWWTRRLRYMQSWAGADPFYVRSTTSPSLQFRSLLTTLGANPVYQFDLTPWQWLYPKVGTGQVPGQDNTRVPAGAEFTTAALTTDGNTDTFIYGAHYYTNFGEFGDKPIGEAFPLVGNRLLEFSADSREVETYEFRPTSMTVNCPVLKKLNLYGCSTLAGALDLSGCTKLEELDLRGTSLSSVVLPQTDTLTTVYLPTLTSLTIVNCDNISTFSMESYSSLVSLITDKSDIALTVMSSATNLASVTLYDMNITTDENNVDEVYEFLADEGTTCNITGSIYLDMGLNSAQKDALIDKFGSTVFISSSSFYISFISVPITSVTLTLSADHIGSNESITIDATFSGNDDATYSWNVTSTNDLTLTRSRTRLVIESGALSSAESITVTYTITKMDNTTVTASTNITLMPYAFLIEGEDFDEYSIDMIFGSNDSSVVYSDGWDITCSDPNVVFTLDSVSVQGGSAVMSGNSITSITKTSLTDGNTYDCTVNLTVDGVSLSYVFAINTDLVRMTIDDISDIQAVNGTGSGNVTFSYPSEYASSLSVVSATVSSGNTNTISNLTIDGCTISVSGYSSSASKTLTLTYKVNNGNNCTATKNFNVAYSELGAKVTATYQITSTDSTSVLYNYCLQYINKMTVDGVEIATPQSSYTFSSIGEHVIEWGFVARNNMGSAFYNITSLKSAIISDATSIGSEAFRGCSGLVSVTIPDGVTSIGNGAFQYCTGLTSITIGSGVTRMGSYVFENCSSLESITSYAITAPSIISSTFYNVKQGGTLTYPEGSDYSTWLSDDPYYLGYYKWNMIEVTDGTLIYALKTDGTSSVKANSSNKPTGELTIPSAYTYNGTTYTITKIDNDGFKQCTGLTSVTIPDSVTSIGYSAFYYCSNLVFIQLSNSLTIIGNSAFYGCSELESITIPSSVTSIGNYSFNICSKLNLITCEGTTAPTLSSQMFWSIPEFGTLVYPEGSDYSNWLKDDQYYLGYYNWNKYKYIDDTMIYALNPSNNTGSVKQNPDNKPSGNITIKDYIEYNGTTYTITLIGNSAFGSNRNITGVNIPNTITEIGISSFDSCSGLTSISIPDSVVKIHSGNDDSFRQCYNITSIHIGKGLVQGLSNNSFSPNPWGENVITSITIDEDNPVYSDGGCNCIIHKSGNQYYLLMSAKTNNIIPNYITYIYSGAFRRNKTITSIVIPSSVTTIYGGAFSTCTKLSSITCERNTAPSVESWTFGSSSGDYTGCESETTNVLYIPEGATGYDRGYWQSVLLNPDKCNFSLSTII